MKSREINKRSVLNNQSDKNLIHLWAIKISKEEIRYLLLILFLGFILRLLFILETQSSPFIQHLFSDPKIYNDWAKDIYTNNKWFGEDVFFMSPFYPYLLAFIYKLFGESILLIRIIQAIISSLNIFFIYLIGRDLFNKSVSYISTFISSLYLTFIFYSGLILSETIQTFLVTVLIYLLVKSYHNNLVKNWFGIGLLLGILMVIRANIWLFFLILVFWLALKLWNKEYSGGYIRKSLVYLIIGVALPILPVALNNYFAANDFVLITSNGGINFYLGNNKDSQGVFSTPAEFDFYSDMSGQKYAEEILKKKLKPSDASNYWYSRGLDFILNHPLKATELLLTKVFLFFGASENPQSSVMDEEFYKENYSKILQIPLFKFSFVSYLAIFGFLLTWKEKKRLTLIFLFVLSYVIASVIFFVNGRYRLAVTPVLIIFASVFLYKLYFIIMDRSFKVLIVPGISVVVFILIYTFVIPKPIFSNYDAYQYMGNIEYENKNFEQAIMNYNKSLNLRDYYQTYINLGNAYAAKKDYRSALVALQMALNRNPNYALTYFNIGLLHSETSNYPMAVKSFLRAIELNPLYAEAYRNLAIVYYIQENYAESLDYFNKYLKLSDEEDVKKTVIKDIENIKIKLRK